MLKRRNLVKGAGVVTAIVLAPGLYLIPKKSDAAGPLIGAAIGVVARFILGTTVRRGAASAATHAARAAAVRQAAKSAANSKAKLVSKKATGMTGTSVAGVSVKGLSFSGISGSLISVPLTPKIEAMSKEHGANLVWAKSGHINTYGYEVENTEPVPRSATVAMYAREATTDELVAQLTFGDKIIVGAEKAYTYSFELEKLDYEGVIRLTTESDDKHFEAPPSDKIIVADEKDIFLDIE